MKGIVSLISDFSVNCVMEGGRISLAHLMEFSNFVDLYVLEDDIYMDVSSKEVTFAPYNEDKDCPLRTLPENKLSNAVFSVSDSTRAIYDASPTRSFDLDSYDYWLKLSKNDKDKVSKILSNTEEYWGRNGLLVSSKRLENHIRLTLEELSKTSFTLMPSPRNLVPFLDVFHQLDTPALLMYRDLVSQHRQQMDKVFSLLRPRKVYLPPLLTVLLSRCEKTSDIPFKLIELRGELKDFRVGIANWFEEFEKADSFKEKIEVRDDFDDAISTMSKKFGDTRTSFYKEMLGSALEGVEDGDPKKILTKPLFKLLEEGVTNFLPDKLASRRFTGLVDLMDQALKVEDNNAILKKVFGKKLDISQKEITSVRKYRQSLVSKFNLDVPMPT